MKKQHAATAPPDDDYQGDLYTLFDLGVPLGINLDHLIISRAFMIESGIKAYGLSRAQAERVADKAVEKFREILQ